MDFKKNELINEVLNKYFETFSLTLDTCDFVPEKFLKKIHKYIYKNMKNKFKEVERENRLYLKKIKQAQKNLSCTTFEDIESCENLVDVQEENNNIS